MCQVLTKGAQMLGIRLTRKVSVDHPNLLGFPARIVFSPASDALWHWRIRGGFSQEITPQLMSRTTRRLILRANGRKLEVYEHIGVLRYFGLRGVVVTSHRLPPCFWRAQEYWEAIADSCEVDHTVLPLYTTRTPVRWSYPRNRGGLPAFTEVRPASGPYMKIDVTCRFEGIGEYRKVFELPNRAALEEICAARSPGLPLWLYTPSKVLGKLGWTHHNGVEWLTRAGLDPKEAMRRIVLHRAQDLLGALSLHCYDGLFVADVISQCSGHQADAEVVRAMTPYICRY